MHLNDFEAGHVSQMRYLIQRLGILGVQDLLVAIINHNPTVKGRPVGRPITRQPKKGRIKKEQPLGKIILELLSIKPLTAQEIKKQILRDNLYKSTGSRDFVHYIHSTLSTLRTQNRVGSIANHRWALTAPALTTTEVTKED